MEKKLIRDIEEKLLASNNKDTKLILACVKATNKIDKSKKVVPSLIILYNKNKDKNEYMIFENKFSEFVLGLHINDSFDYFKKNFDEWFSNYDYKEDVKKIFDNSSKWMVNSRFYVNRFDFDEEQIKKEIEDEEFIDEAEKKSYYNNVYNDAREAAWEDYLYDNFLVVDGRETWDIVVNPQGYYGNLDFDDNDGRDIMIEQQKVLSEDAIINNAYLIKRFFKNVNRLFDSGEWELDNLEVLIR